jgi:pimeloyl-ACP methyl ester carboxylesterase
VWPDRETILATYRSRPPFSRWREEFLRAYVEEGAGPAPGGGVAWRCHPRWEARCFTTCPYDIWRDVARVRCPTLVIYGLESNTFLGAAARRFARTCQSAKLMGLAGTSHFVPMERPEETVAAIAAFVSGLGC